ncbi:MAG: FAD-dependent oxidoreductase [Acidobacteria bacterium]|nr:FAD-dependent oxidoreductase [Acidobacteriota bacterium]
MGQRVLIIGAGLAGLTAARALTSRGVSVVVLDKGRRPGGRMATRRLGEATFDHGAQFFTVRSPEFAALMAEWPVREWCRGFSGDDGHPRFIAPGGMNSITGQMARGLDVRCEVQVTKLAPMMDGFDSAILTAPVPQSLAMLDEPVPELEAIEYDRCLALMLRNAEQDLPSPGAIQTLDGEPVSWIADNHAKGVSGEPRAITIHAGPEFSLRHWETPEEDVVALLATGSFTEYKLHRWKFAKPRVLYPERCYRRGNIVFAGDAFGEARVEGAVLSGLAAAEALD